MSTIQYEENYNLKYPKLSMVNMIRKAAEENPQAPAFEFYNKRTNFSEFSKRIDRAAKGFIGLGIGEGDVVSICLPNIPQALDCFYGLNRIGAVSNMIHPLSAKKEITRFVEFSGSKAIITVDIFCEKVQEALKDVPYPVTLIVARIQDELPALTKIGYVLTKGRSFLKFPTAENSMDWNAFLSKGSSVKNIPDIPYDNKRTAVILYSGGTSGLSKGICLTDLNFNACAIQAKDSMGVDLHAGHFMLSCMPIFHGFGLGINIHTILIHGACCILMPSFTIDSYAEMLKKKQPNFIAGVPTIFEALLRTKTLNGVDMSFLKGMFCGGDSLSVELKKKVDAFLKDHNADIQIREGYGLTECVTACCLTPRTVYKPGSVGLPFADTAFKIVKPGTSEEMPYGEEGEIILTGPTLMTEYLKAPEETEKTLRTLSDGKTWLYTGDLGKMDEEGYVYFVQRIKRMIISKGYNIYPGQLENVIDSVPEVSYSCVVGLPDEYRGQRVAAYVVLKDGSGGNDELKNKIMESLKADIAAYALPKEIVFKKELPKTLVGKVNYRACEEMAIAEMNK